VHNNEYRQETVGKLVNMAQCTSYSGDCSAGDVPVYQQCGIGTIVGKIVSDHSQ